MNKGEEFKDDFRKALPREIVLRLARRSAWRASAAILHDLVVLAITIGIALAYWPNPIVILVCVMIIGTRQHALFVIAHDAAHYLLYESRKINDLAGRACAMLQGLSMCTYRVIHRLHHMRAEARLDRNAVIVFHSILLVLFAASGYLIQYLVLWILPLATVVQAILRLRAISEHGAITDFSSPLTAARTNVVPAWLAWLIFPHSVNYHIEHHLYASVPHYNLAELHREMTARGVLDGAEVIPFAATLGKIFAERAPA